MTLTLQQTQLNEANGKHRGNHRAKPVPAAAPDPDEISLVAFQPHDLYREHALSEPLQMRIKLAVDIFSEELKR